MLDYFKTWLGKPSGMPILPHVEAPKIDAREIAVGEPLPTPPEHVCHDLGVPAGRVHGWPDERQQMMVGVLASASMAQSNAWGQAGANYQNSINSWTARGFDLQPLDQQTNSPG